MCVETKPFAWWICIRILRVYENGVLRKIFGSKIAPETGGF